MVIGSDLGEESLCRELIDRYGSPLLVYDADVVRDRYAALTAALPNVQMFYAVKAHPHESIIRTIDDLGGGFDVASAGETDLLVDLKVYGRRTIHTHPIKKDDEIRSALRFGVTTFVCDNLYEIEKLVPYRSRVGVLLRISFRSDNATVDLSRKFGCDLADAGELIRSARKLGIHIKGLSFHVGSQCRDSVKHVEAISACRELMHALNQHSAAPMNMIDIGGGFPADYDLTGVDIDKFCQPIRDVLSQLPDDWTIIAEPGRYLVAEAVRSVTTVVGKSIRSGIRWYYLDDGVYGSYSGQIYDHAVYPLKVFRQGQAFTSTLAGPTCDSIDIVAESIDLPELEPGDLVIGMSMGAYTAATRTRFNSLPDAQFIDLGSHRGNQ